MKTDIQITNIQIGVLIAGKVWWRNSITVHRKSFTYWILFYVFNIFICKLPCSCPVHRL